MEIINPATQWHTWLLAAPIATFWCLWVFLLARYVADEPLSLRLLRTGYLLFFGMFLTSSLTLSVLKYQAFKSGPLGTLPSGDFMRYVAGYVELHYWRAWVVGIGVALAFAVVFWLVKKYSGGRIINQQEFELSLLFGFFNPWPQTIVFFVLAFLLFVLASFALTLTFRFFPSFFTKETGERAGDGSFSNLRSGAGMVPDPRVGGGEASLPAGRQGQGESPRRGDERFENEFIPRPFAAEPPRLLITPFLFIAAFFAPIITRPILLDWLHLNVIFITTS